MGKAVIEGWPKTLDWSSFKEVKKAVEGTAYCGYRVWPVYEKTKLRLGNAWGPKNLKVVIKQDRAASWFLEGKNTPETLRHEQGHYDIGGVAARSLWRVLSLTSSKSPKALDGDVATATGKIRSQLRRMNFQYDSETRHGEDPTQQKRWERLIQGWIDENKSLPDPKHLIDESEN